jgi:hypothetical protein
MQSVPITTNVVSSNPTLVRCNSIPHYVIKFVSNLQQVSGFLWVLRFPPPHTRIDGVHIIGMFIDRIFVEDY